MVDINKRDKARQALLERIRKEDVGYNSMILELSTGVGKTFLSLDIIERDKSPYPWIILSPEIAQCDSLERDIDKFGKNSLFTSGKLIKPQCYASIERIKKEYKGKKVNIWFDECHHLTELKTLISQDFDINRAIYTSAVIPTDIINRINTITTRQNTLIYKSTAEAIREGLLPPYEVDIYTIRVSGNKTIERKSKKGVFKISPYENLTYLYNLYKSLSKKRFTKDGGDSFKYNNTLRYLKKAIGECKQDTLEKVYNQYKSSARILTFCSSIEQMERLDANRAVHYKRGKNTNQRVIKEFNDLSATSLLALGMLKEGVNLEGIEIGIVSDLSVVSGDSIDFIQQTGRISRSTSPKIILLSLDHECDKDLLKRCISIFDKQTTVFNNYKV